MVSGITVESPGASVRTSEVGSITIFGDGGKAVARIAN